MQTVTKPFLKLVAIHESGHAVAGMACGIEMVGIFVEGDQAICYALEGDVNRRNPKNSAIFSISGYIAELLFSGNHPDNLELLDAISAAENAGDGDNGDIHLFFTSAEEGGYDPDELFYLTLSILLSEWDRVEEIAGRLLDQGGWQPSA